VITFRRLRNGSWGVQGPISEMRVGTVTATRRNGETSDVEIVRLGSTLTVRGQRVRVGILAPRRRDDSSNTVRRAPAAPAAPTVPCADCGNAPGVIEYRDDLVCERCAPAALVAEHRAAQAANAPAPSRPAPPRAVERTINTITRVGSLDVGAFVFAGQAFFTVTDSNGERRTFKVSNSQRTQAQRDNANGRSAVYFVSVLTGSNNDSDYSYMGIVPADTVAANAPRFVRTRNSRVGENSLAHLLFTSLIAALYAGELPAGWAFHHDGRCARCGRRLTVPESIESGFGPECVRLAAAAIAA
jgi:Family of unknown function (DUF6011)